MAPVLDRRTEVKGSKEPLVASLLSMLFPGLGQLYNGQFRKGLLFQISAILSYFLMGSLALVSSIFAFVAGIARQNNVKLNDGLLSTLSNVPAPFMFILSVLLLGFVGFAARDAYGKAILRLYPKQGSLYPNSFIEMPEALSCSYIFHITSAALCFILAFFFFIPPPPRQQVTEFEFIENQASEKPKEKTNLKAPKASIAGGKFDPRKTLMAPRSSSAANAQSKPVSEHSAQTKSEPRKSEPKKSEPQKNEPKKTELQKSEPPSSILQKNEAKLESPPAAPASPKLSQPVLKPILKPIAANPGLPKPLPASLLASVPNTIPVSIPSSAPSSAPGLKPNPLSGDLSRLPVKVAPSPLTSPSNGLLNGPAPIKPVTVVGSGPALPTLRNLGTPGAGMPLPQIGPVAEKSGTAGNTNGEKAVRPVPISGGPNSSSNSSSHIPGPSRAGNRGTTDSDKAGYNNGPMVSPVVSSPERIKGNDNGINLGKGKGKSNPNADQLPISYAEFMSDLQKRIKRSWYPPKGPDSSRIKVTFAVLRSGELVDSSIRLVSSSGVTSADQAAISAIRNAAPYRTLPDGAPERIDVEFTFDYSVFGGHLH